LGYGGMEDTAGYWWDLTREFVFYKDVAQGEKRSFETLHHEAFHQYMHFLLGVPPGIWFDEGFACYFEGFSFSGNQTEIKPSQRRRGVIRNIFREQKQIPLKEFIRLDHSNFMAHAQLCYAQAWALIFFLQEANKAGTKEGVPWRNLFQVYMSHLVQARVELETRHPEKKATKYEVNYLLAPEVEALALERTFGTWTETDWQHLEEEYISFYK
ncbi:MAG: DUF1570 domain-containing protein, partial [Planctomycetes bacterium]|nr:DUF1570 domain-containing protein [Planctomycetota bacterium]